MRNTLPMLLLLAGCPKQVTTDFIQDNIELSHIADRAGDEDGEAQDDEARYLSDFLSRGHVYVFEPEEGERLKLYRNKRDLINQNPGSYEDARVLRYNNKGILTDDWSIRGDISGYWKEN